MQLYINQEIKKYFSTTQPLFKQLMALQGESFRKQPGRLTQRVLLGDKYYFIKQHTGVGWREIIKNLLQGRWPVVGAKPEWRAIEKLKQIGINVPAVVAYGQCGLNPARLQSFILMEELTETISLEDLSRNWRLSPPQFAFKQRLITAVADIARRMHAMGINHRDFYICHFLYAEKLFLIDLHRAQLHRQLPVRWRVKDLSGLYFSSKDIGLTERDRLRFIRAYSQKSLRESLQIEKDLWQKVFLRGEQLYRDHHN